MREYEVLEYLVNRGNRTDSRLGSDVTAATLKLFVNNPIYLVGSLSTVSLESQEESPLPIGATLD